MKPIKFSTFPKLRSKVATEELLKKVPHITFVEARRFKEPIYEALLKELYEEGCMTAARHFTCLVEKEKILFANYSVRYEVKDERQLLINIVEKVKQAEKLAKFPDCKGMPNCLNYLYETLTYLYPFDYKFHWLINELYIIYVHFAEKYEDMNLTCTEVIARLYCGYAMYMATRSKNVEISIQYFEKSLRICRGENWLADQLMDSNKHFTSLHEFVATKLSNLYLEYAQSICTLDANAKLALQLVRKAILVTAEITTALNLIKFCEVYLIKIRMLLQLKMYKEAMRAIILVESYLQRESTSDFARVSCEVFLLKGQWYYECGKYSKAMLKYKQTLLLSNKYDFQLIKGQTLLHMGKFHMDYSVALQRAKEEFIQAKSIFTKLGDKQFIQCATYSLATLAAKSHFRQFINVLRKEDDFCSLMKLRKWKDRLIPFWDSRKRQSMDTTIVRHVSEFSETLLVDVSSSSSEKHTELSEDASGDEEEWMWITDTLSIQSAESEAPPRDEIHCLLNEYQ